MQVSTLAKAVEAAERFIEAAKENKPAKHYRDKTDLSHVEQGMKAANTKRTSMDLSRALADLRANR